MIRIAIFRKKLHVLHETSPRLGVSSRSDPKERNNSQSGPRSVPCAAFGSGESVEIPIRKGTLSSREPVGTTNLDLSFFRSGPQGIAEAQLRLHDFVPRERLASAGRYGCEENPGKSQ